LNLDAEALIFTTIDYFISKNNVNWRKGISICTDGVKAMSGSCCGLWSL